MSKATMNTLTEDGLAVLCHITGGLPISAPFEVADKRCA